MEDQRLEREGSQLTDDQLIYQAKLWTVAGFAVAAIDFAIIIITRRVDWPFAGFLLALCCRLRAVQLLRRTRDYQEK